MSDHRLACLVTVRAGCSASASMRGACCRVVTAADGADRQPRERVCRRRVKTVSMTVLYQFHDNISYVQTSRRELLVRPMLSTHTHFLLHTSAKHCMPQISLTALHFAVIQDRKIDRYFVYAVVKTQQLITTKNAKSNCTEQSQQQLK